MARFVISGYFGFDNAGDEAILAAMVQHLKECDPACEITVLSGNPARTIKTQGQGVRAILRTDLRSVVEALRRSDLFVSGGGSLLQDVTSSRSIPYYLGLVGLAKILGKRVFFYSQGVGPIRGILGRTMVRWICNRVDAVTVRDSESLELLRSLGITKPPITVVPDPVFGLRRIESGTPDKPDTADRPLIGFALREWPAGEGFWKALGAAADELISRLGARVVFIPFQFPRDVEASKRVAGMMRGEARVVGADCAGEECLHWDKLMALIGSLHLLVGMRYHALVFAAVMGVPFVGISYDPKVSHLLRLLGESEAGNISDLTADTLVAKVTEVWARRGGTSDSLRLRVGALGEEARMAATKAYGFVVGN